jgi:VIT1/CCC1 family predicted Fe2+/Mn2+ transporter
VTDSEPVEARATGRAIASLRDVILGGQDGLVNVLGLVLGMAAATGDSRVVVTAALAAMFAESIAMAGVAYTATGAERDWATRTRARVSRAIGGRAEARQRRRLAEAGARGYSDATIELIDAAGRDEANAWASELEFVERELAPVRTAHPVRAALTVGLSTIVGSAVPLAPFVVFPIGIAVWVSLVAGTIVLFTVGAYRARLAGSSLLAAGLQMTAIGLVSALAGYVIGVLLRAPVVG